MQFDVSDKAALGGGFFLCAVLYLLAISSPLIQEFGPYDAQRIIEIAAITIICLLFPPTAFPNGFMGYAIGCFFVAGVVAAFNSANPLWAAIEHLRFLLLFFVALNLATAGENAHKIYIYSITLIASLLAVKVSIGIYVINQLGGGIPALADAFSNHRHFTEFFVGLECFFAFFLLKQRSYASTIATLPLTIISIVIFMGAARASAISLFVSAIVFIYFSNARRLMSLAIIILSIILAWWISEFLLAREASDSILRQHDSGRIQLWEAAIDKWAASPIFGIGPMHFASIPNDIAAHPHNAAVQILCEWGLIGLGSIMTFMIAWWFNSTYAQRGESIQDLPAVAALSGMLVSSFFGGVLVVPAVEFLLFIFLGLTMKPGVERWSNVCGATKTIVRAGCLGLCLLCVFSWTWRTSDGSRGAPLDAPRFWQNGGIAEEADAILKTDKVPGTNTYPAL